jgi:hypothetical protein
VFQVAARQFGFAEVQANFTVLVDALGTVTAHDFSLLVKQDFSN